MLRFRLLGAFEVFIADDCVENPAFKTRQTRLALKLLLAERDQPIRFTRLADLIWPEADADTARNSLQVAIRTLRRVLEPDIRQGSASRYIRTVGEAYQFVKGDSWIDVDEFLSRWQAGLAAERRSDATVAIDAYRSAAALFRGDYLTDEADAEWTLVTRERLRETYLDLADRLAALLATEGHTAEALVVVERALRADPLREELHVRLMRLHALAGRKAHALAAFERCRQVWRAELGVEPSDALVRVRDEILAERAQRAYPDRERAAPTHATGFVGRGHELAAMGHAWTRAAGEAGHLLALVGDAGMGKTRLARQFADRLGPEGHVIWLAANESEQALPLGPLIAFFSSWLDRSATRAQLERLGPSAAALAYFLPQVRAMWPDCPSLATPGPEAGQAFEAMTAAILVRKGRGRAVVVLDDAHWADDETLRWLGYALHRLPSGVAIVATLRQGEGQRERLDRLLSDVRRRDRLLRLEVGPLSRLDVEELLNEGAERPMITGELAGRLHRATGGNALFVVETIRNLASHTITANGSLAIPQSVREAIVVRIERLPAAPREVLRGMAVLGVASDATLIGGLSARNLDEVIDALEALLARRLIRVLEDAHGYVIDHPMVMQVVYESMGPARREALHRRAASLLIAQRLDGGAPATRQILRHLTAATAAPAKIVAFAESAGVEAMHRHAYLEAAECFEAVRDGASRLAGDSSAGRRRARAVEQLGEALWNGGRFGDARPCYTELLETTEDPLARARLLRKSAWCVIESRPDEALDLLDQAERELGQRIGTDAQIERARITGARTIPHFYRSDFAVAISEGERALQLFSAIPGLERDTMEQQIRIAGAEQRLGRLESTEARYRDAMARAQALGDELAGARIRESLAQVLQARGELRAARLLIEEALGTQRQYSVPRIDMIALLNRGWLLTDVGDLPAARAAYQEALSRAHALDLRYWMMHIGVGLGAAEMRLGERRAQRTLERAIELADEIGNRQRKGHAYIYLGELALVRGDPSAARDYAERGLAIAAEINDSHGSREGHAILALAQLASGDAAAAAAAARRGLEHAKGFPLSEGRNLLALGRSRWALGERDGAATDLASAEHIFRVAGARYDLAQARLAQARTVLAHPTPLASAAFSEALALATTARARALAREIRGAVADHV